MIQYSYQISQTNFLLRCVNILSLSLSESRITRKGKGMEEWKNGRMEEGMGADNTNEG